MRDTDLTAREADEIAAAVLAGNARSLYRLCEGTKPPAAPSPKGRNKGAPGNAPGTKADRPGPEP